MIEEYFHTGLSLLHTALTLTGIILVMMLLIEYLNIRSRGKWMQKINRTGFGQVLFGTLLGLVPGCMGTYFVVSLFTHGSIGFGAIIATFIATSGDEAFLMLSLIPKETLILMSLLAVTAIVFGLIAQRLFKNVKLVKNTKHFVIHEEEHCKDLDDCKISNNLKHISFPRALLIFGLVLIILNLFLKGQGHDHGDDHAHFHIDISGIINYIFAGLAGLTLLAILKVPEHFITEHLWGHVIKKHFLKIFLWTFGAILLITVALPHFHADDWIRENPYTLLLIAGLLGMIPESGPHMVFVTLFAGGYLPFGILIASSIVQDGHGALPLLAESQKSFILAKVINLVIGLAVGYLFLLLGGL
ncbi:MAG: hypothetical protein C0592_10820 [Marinilabiliales bacterium]|nr:MAG: hypothetical protein C0592_10820 [Marinilabiliales bacterium]